MQSSQSIALVFSLLLGRSAFAQINLAQVAVPAYSPAHVLQALHQSWTWRRAVDFSRHAQALPVAVKALCDAAVPAEQAQLAARLQWQATTHAWMQLSSVAVGLLITRRAQRQINFSPARPALIERAIQSGPGGPQAMERIGTPAKWLQALGWLLWTQPVAPSSAGCSYAGEVALDIEREALALQHEFTALAANDWSGAEPKTVAAGISALVNPWLGSMERLRWALMEKPMRAASAKGPPDWRHMASGQTAQSWAA